MSEKSSNKEGGNLVLVEGIMEPLNNKTAQLLDPKRNGKSRPTDPFVPRELIRRFKLKKGSYIVAKAQHDGRFANPKVKFIESVDGKPVDQRMKCIEFSQLLTIAPDEQIKLESQDHRMTTRVIDLFCPIGKGQRGLIVAPPRTGKTTLLHDIACGVRENHPECELMVLLVDERPEEVTDFRRTVDATLFASSNDEDTQNHVRIADMAIEYAKRQVEAGKEVVLLLDSLTRLARAHNSAKGGGGRTMTGGLDIRALEKPRQLFSAARNTEEAGSLTIIASALIETGSKMDELIFQEFKGTGNMEMVLNRKVAELRIWPAIDLSQSGTRKEELLLDPDTLKKANIFRRALAPLRPIEAAETITERMSKTDTNSELLALLSS
ncbi:MAG: transcription termination factor Rho [Verrucomicrobiota bacterium]